MEGWYGGWYGYARALTVSEAWYVGIGEGRTVESLRVGEGDDLIGGRRRAEVDGGDPAHLLAKVEEDRVALAGEAHRKRRHGGSRVAGGRRRAACRDEVVRPRREGARLPGREHVLVPGVGRCGEAEREDDWE